jgi:hypothetical protein
MADEPRDSSKRNLGDEIRDTVEQEVHDGVRRVRDRSYRRSMRRRHGPPGIFIGLLIVALGVVFLLDQQGIVPAHESFRFFWGALLMAWGFEIIIAARHDHSWFWGAVLIIVGGGGLIREMGFVHFWIGSLWPLLLIAFGVFVLLQRMGYVPPGGPFHRPYWRGPYANSCSGEPGMPGAPGAPGTPGGQPASSASGAPAAPGMPAAPDPPYAAAQNFAGGYVPASDVGSGYTDSRFSQVAILSGFKRRITSQQFRFANVSAVLGGFELDLRHAEIDGDQAVIQVSCVLGGGEIRIPDTWKVIVETDTVAGGFSDETYMRPADPTKAPKRLVVRGTLVFGGIVIKN